MRAYLIRYEVKSATVARALLFRGVALLTLLFRWAQSSLTKNGELPSIGVLIEMRGFGSFLFSISIIMFNLIFLAIPLSLLIGAALETVAITINL